MDQVSLYRIKLAVSAVVLNIRIVKVAFDEILFYKFFKGMIFNESKLPKTNLKRGKTHSDAVRHDLQSHFVLRHHNGFTVNAELLAVSKPRQCFIDVKSWH